MSTQLPETQFADSHGLSIAYQVFGTGDIDLIIAPGLISHVELWHDFPGYTRFLKRLGEFARVITFDKRGQGLSDGIEGTPSLEDRVDDLVAVMKSAGVKRAALLGFSEGGAMAFLLAATRPSLVSHIITFGAYAKAVSSTDYPYMHDLDTRRQNLGKWVEDWGKGGGIALKVLAPDLADDSIMCKMFARIERYSSTPNAMKHYFEFNFGIDVTDILSSVRVPTLILHREDDLQVPARAGRHLEDSLKNARYVDAGLGGHLFWVGDVEKNLVEMRRFLTGKTVGETAENRVLATVLFTDIVGSTELAKRHGGPNWRELLNRHDEITAEFVTLYRGRVIHATGDGVLAIFDGPGKAVECALNIVARIQELGLRLRAGLHTGEIEMRGEDVSGIGVHIASRIEGLAEENEVLVSKTVTDLMAGNPNIEFQSKGPQSLKGIPGEWEVFTALR